MSSASITQWIAVAISLLALLESWKARQATKHQERRAVTRAEQAEKRALLDSFLLPFQAVLGRARQSFESLTAGEGTDFRNIELYPSALRSRFESLSDSRRIFWQVQIELIQAHNDDGIRLIDGFRGRSHLSSGFLAGCEDFRRHAVTWKAMWKATLDRRIDANLLPGELLAEPFPANFDAVVTDEVERLKTAAGL